jgi:hypothetical protein
LLPSIAFYMSWLFHYPIISVGLAAAERWTAIISGCWAGVTANPESGASPRDSLRAMARSRTFLIPLSLLGLFLLGTVVVLSTVSYYLAIEPTAYLTDAEVPVTAGRSTNGSRALEHVPRIMHQTWKTDILPDRWRAVSKTCTSLMPD